MSVFFHLRHATSLKRYEGQYQSSSRYFCQLKAEIAEEVSESPD